MATGFKINKGIDRPPEVLGIRGMNYLLYLGVGVVGGLLVTALIVVAAGIPAMYGFIGLLIGCYIFFNALVKHSRKYGERGLAKSQAQNRMPKVILVRSTSFLTQMRQKEYGNNERAMTKYLNRVLTASQHDPKES